MAKLLIDGCINLNLQDKDGNTALHYACRRSHNHIVEYLLFRHCNSNIRNYAGERPIGVVRENADILKIFKEYEMWLLRGLPIEFGKMDTNSAHVFSSLLKEESYPHYESRLMLAGEQGTGKTTIARYLVGKRPTKLRMSTDGIELYNGLSYMDRDSKEWLGGKQDFSLEEIIVSRSLFNEENLKKSVNLYETTATTQDVLGATQNVSLPARGGILRLASNETSKSETISEESEFDESCLERRTSNRSHFQDDKIKKSVGLNEGNPTSQGVLAMTQEMSFNMFKVNESIEKIISDTTQSENVTTLSDHQFKTIPVDVGNIYKNTSKQLTGRVFEQTTKEQYKDIDDDDYKTDIQYKLPTSEMQQGSLKTDIQSSDGFVKRNKEVLQCVLPENANTESSDAGDIIEVLPDNEKANDDSDGSRMESGFTSEMHTESVIKPGIIRKLKNFFGISKKVKQVKVSITKETFLEKSFIAGIKQLHNKQIAPIIIWDFGGQDVFYSTHQTFLTYRAIYMIVLDGSRKLDDPCPYEQYLPGKSEHKTARDYLIFWINTIVTYCQGSHRGFPKIMVVLTHKDQVKDDEVEERRNETFAEIRKMFNKTSLGRHLIIKNKIFVNALDENDPEMRKLKKLIMSESEWQPTWGELLPKCFIPLELEFASLIRRNIHLITLEHLRKINSLQPIRPLSEDELKVFLKFQHSIGKLLYFDELKLDDRIILSPTLLIDAFKSIVTEKRFCKGDRKREEIWDAMGKKGVVSKQAIQKVWKRKKYAKFYKDKEYLLDVMNHLDILVEPKRYDSKRMRVLADFYYVASMVRANDDTGYLYSSGITQRNIAIAFISTSMMIPPALSFRFISYCLSVWAVKTYGEANTDMLFHRSGVFTIDPSLDMYILCEDDKIIVRLVHARTNALIMRDLASSINECLTSALEKISQLYIRTSSDQSHNSDASFVTRICCNSPDKPCILPFESLPNVGKTWKCPTHGIEHNIHTIKSWIPRKQEEYGCESGCPVTNEEFLKELPSDLHLRRLSLMYSSNEVRELAIHLGLSATYVDNTVNTGDPTVWNCEVIRQCRDSHAVTFKKIKNAIVAAEKGNIHKLCTLVKGDFIDFDREPEKWDVVPTEEHIDRLVPLVGNKSLPFLIELGMDFHTWERISHKQNERDLVRLNKDILEEWSNKFCRMHSLKPTLRTIAQSFSNIGKNVKIVENALLDLF
ncbi:uncharacterized protein LOC127717491 [Mytilus californianus]|uniref:uncharacterized protein LOC127717491 n=1 Tax=Mytilus californianus TaxID=6549 RepID=UPI00224858BA|nr:uncharacterized protein LOC127717491 [Mytilus californianus]